MFHSSLLYFIAFATSPTVLFVYFCCCTLRRFCRIRSNYNYLPTNTVRLFLYLRRSFWTFPPSTKSFKVSLLPDFFQNSSSLTFLFKTNTAFSKASESEGSLGRNGALTKFLYFPWSSLKKKKKNTLSVIDFLQPSKNKSVLRRAKVKQISPLWHCAFFYFYFYFSSSSSPISLAPTWLLWKAKRWGISQEKNVLLSSFYST